MSVLSITKCIIISILTASISFSTCAEIGIYANADDRNSEIYSNLNRLVAEHGDTKEDIVIVLGIQALSNLLSEKIHHADTHFIVLLLTKREFDKFQKGNKFKSNITAIYSEPAIEAQVFLGKTLFGVDAKIKIPTFDELDNSLYHEEIRQYLMPVKKPKSWLRNIGNTDVVIATPDDDIFSQSNIVPIALSLYRRRIGLIGYSEKMIDVGAIASLYVTRDDLFDSLFEVIKYTEKYSKLPKPTHSKKYRVAINKVLAKTLGLHSIDVKFIEETINNYLRVGEET
ncbi:hypothetical protein [Hahella ganghwensis]|uniref:hypothetical protein n=1 Tax=Hahella ganghwensis TaxID=286420 RepID=UPI000361C819|nr:hypothetical protein [Hahella ganghwensis]